MSKIQRITIGDTLRTLERSEHTDRARAVAANNHIQAIAVALDHIENRCHTALCTKGKLGSDQHTANDGDLAQAEKLADVLELAYLTARAMIEAMRAQLESHREAAPASVNADADGDPDDTEGDEPGTDSESESESEATPRRGRRRSQ